MKPLKSARRSKSLENKHLPEENEKKAKEEKAKTLENAGITGAASEVVQRFGSANREFLVGYSGNDFESSQILKKSLKGISEGKVNPEYAYNNIHQQAGYSAEVAKTSRDNAENIINKNPKRTIRTDDHPDFGTNDTVYDHIETINGQVLSGSGSQMKFVEDPKQLIDKIATGEGGGKNDLSRYLDAKLDLPSDQSNAKAYEKYCIKQSKRLRILAEEKAKAGDRNNAEKLLERAKKFEQGKNIGLEEYCNTKAEVLHERAKRLEQDGKRELAEKYRKQAENYEKVRDNMRDSGYTTDEAVFYREHPKLATALDIAHTSHRAGVDAAKTGAVIAGGMSLIRNIVDVAKGDKEPDEAALAVVKDTAGGAAVSYGTAFAGSALAGVMKNAGEVVVENGIKALKPNAYIQALGKTNLPGTIVTVAVETGKTLGKYFKGEIDGVECLTELGEKGTGMVASAMFATLGAVEAVAVFGKSAAIGQLVIPIPVVGGLIGGMVGYALSSACYSQLVDALKDAKLAREERIRIEAECAEAVAMIRQYRAEMEKMVNQYLIVHINTFHAAFDDMKGALNIGDIDGFIAGANTITKKLGKTPQFETFNEFDALMTSSETVRL
jgi:hypothetical protein